MDFARVFEMPLLGYGGYLPFGLETYTVYHFLSDLARNVHPVSLYIGRYQQPVDLPSEADSLTIRRRGSSAAIGRCRIAG